MTLIALYPASYPTDPFFPFAIVGFYIFTLALIGYVIGSLLLRRQVRPVYVGVGSLIYCAFALLYLVLNRDKWFRTAPYENTAFWYSNFVAYWSLFIIPFMILTYAIGKYRLRHSKHGQVRDSNGTPKSFLKKCVNCGKEIPIASETCQYCNTKQHWLNVCSKR
jgi:hypothetical protein